MWIARTSRILTKIHEKLEQCGSFMSAHLPGYAIPSLQFQLNWKSRGKSFWLPKGETDTIKCQFVRTLFITCKIVSTTQIVTHFTSLSGFIYLIWSRTVHGKRFVRHSFSSMTEMITTSMPIVSAYRIVMLYETQVYHSSIERYGGKKSCWW